MKKKNKKNKEQPKFEPGKEPATEHGGEGLEEYISDDPNFRADKKIRKSKK